MHKWYFDELYDALFVRPAFALGRFFWKRGDEGTIDRFGPDGVAAVIVGGSVAARRLQSGYVYTYDLVMLLGIAAAATRSEERGAGKGCGSTWRSGWSAYHQNTQHETSRNFRHYNVIQHT